ncbi:MAG: hypothetical protein LBR12_00075, partial [Opitutaceae bacterium]|nr:hypothetical protein [Opitutaceae bacterium]
MNTTTPALPLLNRRRFLGSCAALSATPLLSSLPAAGVFSGSGKIKVGLVGCGGRGNGALRNCLDADPGVVVHALGDLFPDRLDASFSVLSKG